MSRKFCITVYRALEKPGPKLTGLHLWRGALARTSAWRSRSLRRPPFATRASASGAGRSANCCLSTVAVHPEPKEGRRICCCYSLSRSWKQHTCSWRRRTARVVQHQSPAHPAAAATTTPASPAKPSKQHQSWNPASPAKPSNQQQSWNPASPAKPSNQQQSWNPASPAKPSNQQQSWNSALPAKPSNQKQSWKVIFRLCTRLRVRPRAIKCKKSHPWRKSSTILDMVPLSFFRNKVLPV